MKKIVFFALLVFSIAVFAEVTVHTVTTESCGTTYELAVTNALSEAVRQVNGTELDSTRQIASAISQESVSVNVNTDKNVNITANSIQNVNIITKGVVKSYRIVSCNFDEADNTWRAVVDVDVAKYVTPGVSPDSRRKIAMSPFVSHSNFFTVGNGKRTSAQVADDLLNVFNRHFVQSRRFAVLTRSDMSALEAEKRFITYNSPVEEMARLGQSLGLDYVVVGTISGLEVSPLQTYTIAVSGNAGYYIERASIEVDYRIVVVATSQIKWADKIRIELSPADIEQIGYDENRIYRCLIDEAGRELAMVMDNIYPINVVQMMSNSELVLDQGGSMIYEGDYYDVFKVGEMIYSPVNGEPLGAPETRIATIQITRVDSKLSYASVIPQSGRITAADVEAGLIARPYRMPAGAYDAQYQNYQPQQPVRPVIKLPFDK